MLTMPTLTPADFITADKQLPHAQHIFGTRDNTYADMNKTIRMFTERLGPIAHMRQTHSNRIVCAEENGIYEDCDALYTDNPDLWLAVKTADCVPILISSPVAVAVIHAGWKGLESDIIEHVFHTLYDEYGLEPHEMHALIGPSISQENYEVDGNFTELFDEQFFIPSANKGKVLMDLRAIAKQQIQDCDIIDLNITTMPQCTWSDDTLFSHRKGLEGTHQRQISLIKRHTG